MKIRTQSGIGCGCIIPIIILGLAGSGFIIYAAIKLFCLIAALLEKLTAQG